jgi:hypothetical protein
MLFGTVARIMLCGRLLALTLAVTAGPATSPAFSHPPVGASAPSDTSGLKTGYWGVFPATVDSNTATFRNRSRSAWEWPLYIPYAAINYPLRWIREGFGKGIIYADKKDLFRYIHLVPVPQGFVPSVFYSQQEDIGVGLDYYNSLGAEDNPFRIRGKYSTERWQKYTAGAIFNRGGKWELHVGGGYKLMPNIEYYGIGYDSQLEDISYYKDERTWAGANFRRRLSESSVLALAGAYSAIDARGPDQGFDPSVNQRFGEDTPAGYNDRSNGVLVRVAWVYNNTNRNSNPKRGTFVGATAGGFVATNTNDISFTAYRFELQQFVPLWHSERALALKGYLNFIDNTGTAEIPFQRMFINETPDMFRGYDTGRFRDVGITGITAEYRFPLTADAIGTGFGLDAVLLADVGQVFGEASEISTDNFTQSYGFGFRAFMNDHYTGAMEFVWSEEDFQFRLSTKQLFQYTANVLFQGREETLIH